jgi:hypothetical protein
VFSSIPGTLRAHLAVAIHASFAATMNDLLSVSGVLALVGGACALTLIRKKDFIAPRAPAPHAVALAHD